MKDPVFKIGLNAIKDAFVKKEEAFDEIDNNQYN